MFAIAGTGHRPNKLGGYDSYFLATHGQLVAFAQQELLRIAADDVRNVTVISGMALGWDLALAEAAARLRMNVSCYFPCVEHWATWPAQTQKWYTRLLQGLMCNGATARYITKTPYRANPGCMELRNQAMVADCNIVLALWDGTPGGTSNCVKHAESVGRHVEHVWDAWLAFSAPQQVLEVAA